MAHLTVFKSGEFFKADLDAAYCIEAFQAFSKLLSEARETLEIYGQVNGEVVYEARFNPRDGIDSARELKANLDFALNA